MVIQGVEMWCKWLLDQHNICGHQGSEVMLLEPISPDWQSVARTGLPSPSVDDLGRSSRGLGLILSLRWVLDRLSLLDRLRNCICWLLHWD